MCIQNNAQVNRLAVAKVVVPAIGTQGPALERLLGLADIGDGELAAELAQIGKCE